MEKEIDVVPTKDLFIFMLTRDVTLEKAIVDLIDNSVDGAINNASDENLSSFSIDITINKDNFKVHDNCGGINLKTAMEYAFKFGRPKSANIDPVGSIGQFGIGMKRTIFKLGEICNVSTVAKDSRFNLNFNVQEWVRDETDWKFNLTDIVENENNALSDRFTEIEITSLYDVVSSTFDDREFINILAQEIMDAHAFVLNRGLKITLNGQELSSDLPRLRESDNIKASYEEFIYKEGTDDEVNIKIYTGIDERELTKGGWYIYCNNRLLLKANQKSITGWESNGIRKYHADVAYFRGYVFFESKNGDILPWTTTKDGINFNSELYQAVLLKMQESMIPVIKFLSNLAREKSISNEDDSASTELQDKVSSLLTKEPSELKIHTTKSEFKAPEYKATKRNYRSITYSIPVSELNAIKTHLNVSLNKEVGEITYRYYVENEMD